MGAHLNKTVQLHDTDATGYLYHPRVFDWASESLLRLLQSRYKPLQQMLKDGEGVIVRQIDGEYFIPVTLGDNISIVTVVMPDGRSTLRAIHHIMRDDVVCVTVSMLLVYIRNGRPVRLPTEFISALNEVTA